MKVYDPIAPGPCMDREAEEKAQDKRMAQAASDWRGLLRAVLMRMRVHGTYADGHQGTGALEAEGLDSCAVNTSVGAEDLDAAQLLQSRQPSARAKHAAENKVEAARPRAKKKKDLAVAKGKPVAAWGRDAQEGDNSTTPADGEATQRQRSQLGIVVEDF